MSPLKIRGLSSGQRTPPQTPHPPTSSPQSSTGGHIEESGRKAVKSLLRTGFASQILPSQGLDRQDKIPCYCLILHKLAQQQVWGQLPRSPFSGILSTALFSGCFKNSSPEMGLSLILTQQSSRMIFSLARQAGTEPKAAHRSQDPERDGIALLISQSERGKRVFWLCCVSGTSKHNGKGREGREGSGGSPRGTPFAPQGQPCWEEAVALAGQCAK